MPSIGRPEKRAVGGRQPCFKTRLCLKNLILAGARIPEPSGRDVLWRKIGGELGRRQHFLAPLPQKSGPVEITHSQHTSITNLSCLWSWYTRPRHGFLPALCLRSSAHSPCTMSQKERYLRAPG